MKPYMLSALILFTVNSYAATTVDCESKEYKYNPTVHDACVDMQQMTTESRKEGRQKFSKILSDKKAAYQNALNEKKAATKTPNPSTPATTQPNMPSTPNNPTISPAPSAPAGSVAPSNTTPSVTPNPGQKPSPQQPKRGVNYY